VIVGVLQYCCSKQEWNTCEVEELFAKVRLSAKVDHEINLLLQRQAMD